MFTTMQPRPRPQGYRKTPQVRTLAPFPQRTRQRRHIRPKNKLHLQQPQLPAPVARFAKKDLQMSLTCSKCLAEIAVDVVSSRLPPWCPKCGADRSAFTAQPLSVTGAPGEAGRPESPPAVAALA